MSAGSINNELVVSWKTLYEPGQYLMTTSLHQSIYGTLIDMLCIAYPRDMTINAAMKNCEITITVGIR